MEELLTAFTKALSEIDWNAMFNMFKEAITKVQESGIFDKMVAAFTEILGNLGNFASSGGITTL
ncbi:MAG: hypothetical protein J6B25_01115 [Clostridia bacterium]|nr:hypothetical protein [Clostridia bacterium]